MSRTLRIYPGADKWRDGDISLNGGPVLGRGAAINEIAYRKISEVAKESGIAVQRQANPQYSGTDADAMIKTAAGTAMAIVSIPNRYMHSPNETASLADLDSASRLIAEYVRSLPLDFDFRP